MRIQHNVMAMNAYRNYTNNTKALSKNLERLSSGYKINRAGDDAAGLAISEKMRAQITGLEAAQKNVKDGISLVNTAEGAMQEVQDMLNRMVYLAQESANGTFDDAVDRKALQSEVDQLRSEINRIADSANFNGIKLLDGSLSTKGTAGADSVKLVGSFVGTKSAATKGVYESGAAFEEVGSNMTAGDTFQYTVGFDDGTSATVTLTMKLDSDGKAKIMVADDGTEYAVTENKPAVGELTDAVVAELNKSVGKQFTVAKAAAGKIKLTSTEAGLDAPAAVAMDVKYTIGGKATAAASTDIGVKTTSALGEGLEIDPDGITEYNGKNYDDAVFTINGKKFVLMTESHTGASLGADGADMNATYGLASDVTILVGGTGGLKSGNANFNQNIAKIAEVTGLKVTDAVNESDFGGTDSGVAPAAGIRLSAGKDTITGGLVLQIGDTSDSYNQLRVGVKDMHTKAMGIDGISVASQADAQAAVDVIKQAINYVSDVRGTLGAISNRLDHTYNNLGVMRENITDAESAIRDTDIAEEMMAYTKNNILVQSAQAMLAQANQVPQGVLQLLQ